MGKTLIAYASKSGTAKEAAGRIAEMLPESDLVDLTAKIPILGDYEAAIIGGGVRIGAVHKETKRFIDANTAKLETMRTAFFITNSFVDDADEIIGKMLPDNLRRQAVFAGTLGGRLDIDNLKGLDKKIAKMVSKSLDEGTRVTTGLDEDALEALISQFR